MIQLRSLVGVVGVALGLSWAGGAKADVVVVPADLANVTQEEGQAIEAVFADAYAEVADEKVTLAKRTQSAPAGDSAASDSSRSTEGKLAEGKTESGSSPEPKPENAQPSPQQLAHELGAQQYITLRATRLSSRIILTAALYSADGTELHRVRMTAASLDDIEPIAERMARALHDRTSTEESRTIDNVTEREGEKKNRTFSEKVMGIKASFDYPVTGGDYLPVVNFGFNGRLEGQSYFLEVGAGFSIPSSGSSASRAFGGVFSEFGADYYLMTSNVSPYVGGGVMPRLIGGDAIDFGANIAVFGQVGLMFFRQSSSRLFLDARIAQNLTPWRTTTYTLTPPYTDTSDTRYPTEFLFAVGMGW
jgi:hypothetical protein